MTCNWQQPDWDDASSATPFDSDCLFKALLLSDEIHRIPELQFFERQQRPIPGYRQDPALTFDLLYQESASYLDAAKVTLTMANPIGLDSRNGCYPRA